jgi:hypothetical protein
LEFIFATKAITQEVVNVAEQTEADIDSERITSRRVGRTLGKLRLRDTRDPGNTTRQWQVKIAELAVMAVSYGVTLSANVTNALNVTNVRPPCESEAFSDNSDIKDINDIKEASDEAGYEERELFDL